MHINNLISFVALIIFLFIGIASIGINKLRCDGFDTMATRKEANKGNYIVKNDGTRIYGNKISWSYGVLSSHNITIDNEKYKITEIKGYRLDGVYFGRYHAGYVKRIIEGKLNVYYQMEITDKTTHCYYYAQRGEDGEFTQIASLDDIKQLVKDCPKSYEIINKSNKQIRKSIQSDPFYLSEIFEAYNNDCQ